MNRDLTCLCTECISLHTIDISNVRLLEICIAFFTDCISCNIDLNISLQILNVTERRFTHNALEHHTSGNAYMNRRSIHDCSSLIVVVGQNFLLLLVIQSLYIRCWSACQKLCFVCDVSFLYIFTMICHIIFCNLKRIFSRCLQFCELIATHLQQLVCILLLILCHFLLLSFLSNIQNTEIEVSFWCLYCHSLTHTSLQNSHTKWGFI